MVKRIGIFIDIPDGKRSRIEAEEHLSCLETVSDLKQKLEEAKAEAEFYKFRCEIKEEELEELRRSEKQKVEEAETDAEFYMFKCAAKDEDVEAAKGDAEYYKFKCDAKDEELEELRQSEKQKVEEAKADTEYYKFKCDAKDEELEELRQSQKELLDELKRAETRAKLHQRLIEELQILLDLDEPRRHAPAAGAVGEAFGNSDEIACDPEIWHPYGSLCSSCRDKEACVVEQILICLETVSDLKQNLEAAKGDTEYYKFRSDAKDEELDELRQSQKELLDELKRAETRAKLHQRLIEELQILLDEDEPRRHAPAAGAVGEAFSNLDEITCDPETWHPTTVCSRCRDEEACVVVLPCNHLCLCVVCELETDRCPDCRATKSGSVLA
ncbi:uncharacterized protein LOC144557940 [Carex rostrata]